jgi:hypothetical protein
MQTSWEIWIQQESLRSIEFDENENERSFEKRKEPSP